MSAACPCGSGKELSACCGPYLEGKSLPATAEALMRSRYTAYVLRDEHYLRKTWHPRTCPAQIEVGEDEGVWAGLRVLRCRQGGEGDRDGEVEFVAEYRRAGSSQRLHELSRFVREHGHWLYLDGRFKSGAGDLPKPARNDPCPCGSGKKYKKCCGA